MPKKGSKKATPSKKSARAEPEEEYLDEVDEFHQDRIPLEQQPRGRAASEYDDEDYDDA